MNSTNGQLNKNSAFAKATADLRGFTLIEILVATSIFVTATVLVTDLFVRVNDTQRKTQSIQTTATDARFAFETIAREARLGQIDYDYYPSATIDINGETELALINNELDPVRFGLRSDVCPTGTTSCLAVCLNSTCSNASDWTSLTPQGIDVTNLKFFIYPDQNPFNFTGAGYNNNTQPYITMTMTTMNTKGDLTEQTILTMQTTVSSRVYRR